LTLKTKQPLSLAVRLVYDETLSPKAFRCGLAFKGLDAQTYQGLVRQIFASAATWKHAHDRRFKGNLAMSWALVKGVWNYFQPSATTRRAGSRWTAHHWMRLHLHNSWLPVLAKNQSRDGVEVIYFGWKAPRAGSGVLVQAEGQSRPVRILHTRFRFRAVGASGWVSS